MRSVKKMKLVKGQKMTLQLVLLIDPIYVCTCQLDTIKAGFESMIVSGFDSFEVRA